MPWRSLFRPGRSPRTRVRLPPRAERLASEPYWSLTRRRDCFRRVRITNRLTCVLLRPIRLTRTLLSFARVVIELRFARGWFFFFYTKPLFLYTNRQSLRIIITLLTDIRLIFCFIHVTLGNSRLHIITKCIWLTSESTLRLVYVFNKTTLHVLWTRV